jgi:hypothetical protein
MCDVARNVSKGAPIAHNSEKAARYLGGLRMLEWEPSATMLGGSASAFGHETDLRSASLGVKDHRSIESVVTGVGANGGTDPFEQSGPRHGP